MERCRGETMPRPHPQVRLLLKFKKKIERVRTIYREHCAASAGAGASIPEQSAMRPEHGAPTPAVGALCRREAPCAYGARHSVRRIVKSCMGSDVNASLNGSACTCTSRAGRTQMRLTVISMVLAQRGIKTNDVLYSYASPPPIHSPFRYGTTNSPIPAR